MGIVGLPNVGKSTLFNTLGKVSIPAENFPFCTIEPNNVSGFLGMALHCKSVCMHKAGYRVAALSNCTFCFMHNHFTACLTA